MKVLLCGECMDLRALNPEPLQPVKCRCGQSAGWWLDPQKGIARFWRRSPETKAFFIGMHNAYVLGAVRDRLTNWDETARDLHDQVTNSPGYHFDKARKNCWAIILQPGLSNDTGWAAEVPGEEKKAEGEQ